MNKNIIFIALILFIIAGVGTYFYLSNTNKSISINPNQTATLAEDGFAQPGSAPTTSQDISSWKTHTSPELGYTISYPPSMQYEQQPDLDRFVLLGETQRTGTEVYDGIIINIFKGSYVQDTLQEFVQATHQQDLESDILNEVGDISTTQVAGTTAYQYTVSSLGTFTHIYLPAGSDNYLQIVYLLEDPNNAGFEQTFSQILGSLKLE